MSTTLKIGLTGGIGSGKSIVAKVFGILGVPVYDADAASKALYTTDKDLMLSVKKLFGEDIYPEGIFDRKKLAEKVFSDPAKLELLNKLVHPPTIRHAEEWMAKQKTPYVIKEAALIFESGSASTLDYVIGVSAPLSLRLNRAMKRDGITKEDVMQRMSRQIDEKIKMSLCDFVIVNDEQTAVLPQVLALHERLSLTATS